MNPFSRILVPLALTEPDYELLRYAAMLVHMGVGTHYHFVHVVKPGEENGHLDVSQPLREVKARVAASFGTPPGIECTFAVRGGERVDTLIEMAIGFGADLTLMGHRKSRTGQRALARRMAMISPCSVWMVPEGAPARAQKILAPVDLSAASADSLSVAAWIAAAADLDSCLALHVTYDDAAIRFEDHDEEQEKREAKAFASFVRPVELHGIDVIPVFEESAWVAKTVLQVARNLGVDLIVMNTRGRSQAAAVLLGSVTTQVMMECQIPILVVKHANAYLNLFQVLTDRHLWSQTEPKTN